MLKGISQQSTCQGYIQKKFTSLWDNRCQYYTYNLTHMNKLRYIVELVRNSHGFLKIIRIYNQQSWIKMVCRKIDNRQVNFLIWYIKWTKNCEDMVTATKHSPHGKMLCLNWHQGFDFQWVASGKYQREESRTLLWSPLNAQYDEM